MVFLNDLEKETLLLKDIINIIQFGLIPLKTTSNYKERQSQISLKNQKNLKQSNRNQKLKLSKNYKNQEG